ncbi:metal ABC transporter solute-binding protein, Zn/Mn family [Nesterenkonia sp. Act20]|uniref:metal ABC transporter substrate-binding protein n=1 Tax=Nesterenkonia sp. Act20 TaxID=1483432 RepID=UPI001C442CEB|nr:zinc ABC transporter substrate-binding protein [Nesterenkonia sp. Act20]
MPASRLSSSVAILAASTMLLSACAGSSEASDSSGAEGGSGETLTVVTSTDVYADLASRILGDTAEVSALVDDTAADPHSYEATPQDRLSVDRADVIVANGGGYDPFLTRLAATSGKEDAVYQIIEGENEHVHAEEDADHEGEEEHEGHEGEEDPHAGHDHAEGFVNEHLWYDLAAMSDFVQDFSAHMGELAPDDAELYQDNADALAAEIDALDERNRAIEAEPMSFLSTEAVSQFLLTDAGLEDSTDEQFLAAVEHGDDVAPRLYQEALTAAADQQIDLLSYNPQTETNQSTQIREAAEDAGVAVLEFNETIPEEHDSYVEWMESNISAVETVVEDARG